ncbi:xanthine dehydrogenase family protein molybdopterin-binding subunit [Pedobacter psychroterrae]|uniref:xanthine dehydrogenase family protein molybdopterin-binding subunit n=1 Tax=Pedobacter psychroterrae TaxID=2530453 RepID=UPI00198271F2|nr:molybdopterin cofactor-binding domain-containing protein [Pedobacter psychroterrae]
MNATENPLALPNIDRRQFFKLGGGLAVAIILQDVIAFAADPSGTILSPVPSGQVAAWIHIGEDNMVTVFTGKVEVGQNIRTSLTQQVAEELNVDVSSIKMVMGDTDLVPFDNGTYGSLTTPQMGTQLRHTAATARQALLDLAAKHFSSEVTSLKAAGGMVSDQKSGKKISFGALTKGQQILIPISKQIPLINPAEWKTAGKTTPKVNDRTFITGGHKYVSDMKMPDMLYAKILRPPVYQAKLLTVDLDAAKAMSGVTVIQDGTFIAVAAASLRNANSALLAIKATWESPDQPSKAQLFEYLVKNARETEPETSEIKQSLTASEQQHSDTYTIDYIAHVPLETRSALAQWIGDKLTVWTGTQRPFGVQQDLAAKFDIPKENVRVMVPDTGSGYGGKHSGEAALEAAHIAKETKRPVKLAWTRKEEFTWAYFRPAGVIKVKSGFKKDGAINAWKFENYNSGNAGLKPQYRIPNQQNNFHPSLTPLKQGSYRGLAATANAFARESHISDIARMIDMDQLEFRLKNLDDARLKAVLEAAAKSFGWHTKQKRKGCGYGIACDYVKGGYVATCAEVMVTEDNLVKIVRITEAFDCGAIVNPHHLEHQILGAIVQGLGGALFESVDFENGKILNPNLSDYRVPRFKDTPEITIVMVNRTDIAPSGAGEAPIVSVAPAIRNAILQATGTALRSLPLLPTGKLERS